MGQEGRLQANLPSASKPSSSTTTSSQSPTGLLPTTITVNMHSTSKSAWLIIFHRSSSTDTWTAHSLSLSASRCSALRCAPTLYLHGHHRPHTDANMFHNLSIFTNLDLPDASTGQHLLLTAHMLKTLLAAVDIKTLITITLWVKQAFNSAKRYNGIVNSFKNGDTSVVGCLEHLVDSRFLLPAAGTRRQVKRVITVQLLPHTKSATRPL